jgi:hypothetical protein
MFWIQASVSYWVSSEWGTLIRLATNIGGHTCRHSPRSPGLRERFGDAFRDCGVSMAV